jgi:hypothetical protein
LCNHKAPIVTRSYLGASNFIKFLSIVSHCFILAPNVAEVADKVVLNDSEIEFKFALDEAIGPKIPSPASSNRYIPAIRRIMFIKSFGIYIVLGVIIGTFLASNLTFYWVMFPKFLGF